MTRPDLRYDLDLDTAERLICLDETVVTPQLAPLARALRAAASVADLDERTGEERALAAFRAVMVDRSDASSRHRHRRPVRAKAAAWVVGFGVVFSGGISAAGATGYLPESAQRAAQELFEHVGIHIPGPADTRDEGPAELQPAEPNPAEPDPADLAPVDPEDVPITGEVNNSQTDETAENAAADDPLADLQSAQGGTATDNSEETSDSPDGEAPAPTASPTPPGPPPRPAPPVPPNPPTEASAAVPRSAGVGGPASAAGNSAESGRRPDWVPTTPAPPAPDG